MTEEEKKQLYIALDTHNVEKKERLASYRTETNYIFGLYRITFIQYKKESSLTPRGHVQIWGANNRYLVGWNQTWPEYNYVYDMYVAARHKSNGEPYENPYANDMLSPEELTAYFGTLLLSLDNIFPKDMPKQKSDAVIEELRQVYHKHMVAHHSNLQTMIQERVKS